MEIGLINPNKGLKHAAVHIGIGYLASYAREIHKDLNIKILDTRISKETEIDAFLNTKYDLIGITASSQVFLEAVEVAAKLKTIFPDTPICLGGSHTSTVKEESIEGFPFDFAIYGEGEISFSELIGHIKGEVDLSTINGLIYKNASGSIIVNPPRAIIKDIDKIPFPAYDLFDMASYPQHRMTTSRGCPFNCVFCNSHSLWTNKWRKRSSENLIEEIKILISKYKRKTIVFNDDSFNIDAKRVIKFCDELISQKLNIIWSTSVRVDLITPEIATKMKKSGCYNVSIGVESANNEVLEKINKKTTHEKISKGINILRDAGIDVMGQFMIGNPGDNLETVKESIEFAKNSNLTGVEFYTALPYKDSLLWEFVKEHGRLLTSVESYEYHTIEPRIVYDTPDFSYDDRLKAIELAKENGFYDALTTDEKILMLDIGKNIAKNLQRIFAGKFGNKIYLGLRNLYRKMS
ncbi:MAG: B12-binding domain-containing radical SAM protein [Saprospiraceae bacterium]|nr:B12-binding domain-containing radical SAM protein [Saprospiraceae bacterium]